MYINIDFLQFCIGIWYTKFIQHRFAILSKLMHIIEFLKYLLYLPLAINAI